MTACFTLGHLHLYFQHSIVKLCRCSISFRSFRESYVAIKAAVAAFASVVAFAFFLLLFFPFSRERQSFLCQFDLDVVLLETRQVGTRSENTVLFEDLNLRDPVYVLEFFIEREESFLLFHVAHALSCA